MALILSFYGTKMNRSGKLELIPGRQDLGLLLKNESEKVIFTSMLMVFYVGHNFKMLVTIGNVTNILTLLPTS